MNCYYHKDKESTTECISCGKPLCRACSAYWGANLCTHCIKSTALKKRAVFILRLIAVILLTTLLFYLFYCKIGGRTPTDALSALTGSTGSERKTVVFVYALACIPVGLRAALLLGRRFAQAYELNGNRVILCFIAVIAGGLLLGGAAMPIYCIWLIYNTVKYNVTAKAAKTRLDKLSGKNVKSKRTKRRKIK